MYGNYIVIIIICIVGVIMGIAVAGDYWVSIEWYVVLLGIDFDIIVIFSVVIIGCEKCFW